MAMESVFSLTVSRDMVAPICCSDVLILSIALLTFVRAPAELAAPTVTLLATVGGSDGDGCCCVALGDREGKRVGGTFACLERFTGIGTVDQGNGIELCF